MPAIGSSPAIGSLKVRPTVTSDRPASTEALNGLLARVAETGDRQAFSQLFEFFAPRVKAYLLRIGCSSDLAEDIAQETMLKVWRKARLFDPSKAAASTWIYTIARNLRIDAIRRLQKPELDADEPGLVPEAEPRPDAEAERADRDRRIRSAFGALPPNQHAVVAMHFFDDEPHTAIAERLGLPLGTVKSRLRLAFARIRKELDDVR